MAEKKTNKQKDATAAYLESLGVTVPQEALAAPSIDSIRVGSNRPTDWIDANGDPVPQDLEFYRVDLTAGDKYCTQCIHIKEREGFVKLPKNSGFGFRGLSEPDQEVIMMRTQARKRAWEEAEARARASKQGTHRSNHGPIGTTTETYTERVPLRR